MYILSGIYISLFPGRAEDFGTVLDRVTSTWGPLSAFFLNFFILQVSPSRGVFKTSVFLLQPPEDHKREN